VCVSGRSLIIYDGRSIRLDPDFIKLEITKLTSLRRAIEPLKENICYRKTCVAYILLKYGPVTCYNVDCACKIMLPCDSRVSADVEAFRGRM